MLTHTGRIIGIGGMRSYQNTNMVPYWRVPGGFIMRIIEGSLEVKLPARLKDGKTRGGKGKGLAQRGQPELAQRDYFELAQPGGKSQRRERQKKEDQRTERERESQAKEDTGAQTGGKVAKHCVFPCSSRVWKRKSRLAKASGVQPSGEMRDEKIRCRCNAKHISKQK